MFTRLNENSGNLAGRQTLATAQRYFNLPPGDGITTACTVITARKRDVCVWETFQSVHHSGQSEAARCDFMWSATRFDTVWHKQSRRTTREVDSCILREETWSGKKKKGNEAKDEGNYGETGAGKYLTVERNPWRRRVWRNCRKVQQKPQLQQRFWKSLKSRKVI